MARPIPGNTNRKEQKVGKPHEPGESSYHPTHLRCSRVAEHCGSGTLYYLNYLTRAKNERRAWFYLTLVPIAAWCLQPISHGTPA